MLKQKVSKYISLLPILLIMCFLLLPVILVLWISFFSSELIVFPPPGYSLKWYLSLFNKKNFVKATGLSLQIALISTTISVVVGTMTSIGLNEYKSRGKGFLQSFYISPLVVPSIVTGIAIYTTFASVGRLTSFRLVPSSPVLILGHVLITIPWAIRLISSGLTSVDKSLEEAAMNLGASRLKAFLYIVFPQIRASMLAAAIFTFIVSFSNLEISLMLVGPGQSLLPIETLNYVLWNMDPTIAALSSLQVVMVLALLLIVNKLVGLGNVF